MSRSRSMVVFLSWHVTAGHYSNIYSCFPHGISRDLSFKNTLTSKHFITSHCLSCFFVAQIFKSERQDHRVVSCGTQTQTTSPSGVICSAWFEKARTCRTSMTSAFQLRSFHGALDSGIFCWQNHQLNEAKTAIHRATLGFLKVFLLPMILPETK